MNRLSPWGRVYVATVATIGAGMIAQSALELYLHPVGWNWLILAVLTLASGSATVKLPSVPATISISETFVFTSALLFGTAAGTLTVALDALVISWWLARRGHPLYRIVFNVFALPAALWIGAQLYYLVSDVPPLYKSLTPVPISQLLVPLFLFTLTYFTLNSFLIAIAIAFEKQVSPVAVWRDNFAWLSWNYFGGASIAALLVSYTRNIDYAYLLFVLPLLAVLYFTFSVSMGRVEDANRHLTQLNHLYMSTIETLAMAIDAKDQITHGHIRRVQQLALGLARRIGVTDSAQISAIEAASLLHDMGKLAVPEYILNKPGKLTPAEFERMKLHASVGADILSSIEFPYPVVPIVRHHHENWDGTGYPDGLKASEIPIGARILSVVDCFDALTSDRPYRPRLSNADALQILVERRGSMYDPLIVDTFVRVHGEILAAVPESSATPRPLSTIEPRALISSDNLSLNTASLEEIAASTEEMLSLYDLAKGLTANIDVADAADVIAKHLRRIVPASTVAFFLYEPENDELVVAHTAGESSSHFAGLRIPRGQRLTGWVAANRQSIANSDPVLDLGDIARSLRPPLRSCLSAPLVSGSQLVGVLTVYSPLRDAFREDHRRILEIVARQVSQTVLRAASFEKERALKRDQATGLPDAEYLRRLVDAEIAQFDSADPLSLILISSKTTVGFGLRHGDEPPAFPVDAVRSALRQADIVFRYENEELVILLLHTNHSSALGVAKRVATKLANAEAHFAIGIATAPAEGNELEQLLDTARRLAYSVSDFVHLPPSIH